MLDEPELPELPDDLDDPDDPDEPDEALRPVCPLLLEPDIPPEFSLLPEDPTFRSRSCDELDELPLTPLERSDEELLDALRALPCEPDDDPALPPTLPVLEPLDEACRSRSGVACPSPCDELPRSRFELPDEALLSLWPLFDEPEVFRSRSAINKSSKSGEHPPERGTQPPCLPPPGDGNTSAYRVPLPMHEDARPVAPAVAERRCTAR